MLNFLGTERIFDGAGEYWFDVVVAINQLVHAVYDSRVRRGLRTVGLYSVCYGAYMHVLAMIYGGDVLPIEVGEASAEIYTVEPPEIVSVLDKLEKERPVIEAFVAALDEDAVVWDVGANLGVYAVLAADVAETVVAFEPVPVTVRRYEENLTLNGADGQVVAAALGDRRAETTIQVERDELGTQTPWLGDDSPDAGMSWDVRTIDGDSWIQEHSTAAPDVLKIDVEGAEAAVLDGLERTLADTVEFVLVETHEGATGFRERLEAVGFDVEQLHHAGQPYLVGRRR